MSDVSNPDDWNFGTDLFDFGRDLLGSYVELNTEQRPVDPALAQPDAHYQGGTTANNTKPVQTAIPVDNTQKYLMYGGIALLVLILLIVLIKVL